MSDRIRWGILSTGKIAHTFAHGLRESQSGTLVAVASRSLEGAQKFVAEFESDFADAKPYGDYAELLADPNVDAVYIATLHPFHAEWAIKAADAKKHVLCEKPLTLNSPEAARVVEAAHSNGVQLMEAFMYRCHPQTAKIVELVQNGALGEVRQIEATFAFQAPDDPESRLLSLELGGGGILDVGCYVVSFFGLAAGAVQGKTYAEPTQLKALGKLGATGADDFAGVLMTFGDVLAIGSTGVRVNGGGFARILGSKANLRVPSPWFCGADPHLILEPHGSEAQPISVPSDRGLYALEADLMAEAIRSGQIPSPAQSGDDALKNMLTLDRWRREIGLVYLQETPSRLTQSASGEALRVRENSMRYGTLEGVVDTNGEPKRVSKLVMGTMLEGAIEPLSHGLALFDDFFERGGTAFDTARVYANGAGEKVVGHWLRTRGVRDDLTLIVKGAHPPLDSPDGFRRELEISLEQLDISGSDIYMLHRDNEQIPVSEWVEALNEGVQKGFYRVFGGSNWSLERVAQANLYAREKGLQGFSVLSNNFSLARMVDPVWNGCVSSSDAASRGWLEEHEISLFSWSSQARGFFARPEADLRADAELMRCWASDDNFERRARAQELARQKGVSPVVIAAAYVLAQPFPIYALIGPRSLAETRDSMHAFEIELSPAECAWLNLESDELQAS